MSEANALDSFQMQYEDMAPHKLKTRKGGKGSNIMAKPEVKTTNNTTKSKYAKTRGEHLKDLVIVALVIGVIAFIGGVHYADSKNAEMITAVKAAQTTAVAPATDAKK